MSTAMQRVNVFGLQDRRSQPTARRPWLVRWAIDGQQRGKAFRTKPEADRYRAALMIAAQRGERFDRSTGEPTAWRPRTEVPTVFEWSRQWLAEQWPEWQPRTRASAVEAIARFVIACMPANAAVPPLDCRRELARALDPDGRHEIDAACERWVTRWSPPLNELSRQLLATVDGKLGTGDQGQALAAETASRLRKVARACIRRAVELEVLDTNPWPPPPRGRSRRKAARPTRRVDVRSLPDPATMARAIEAIPTHHPSSRMYQVMVSVMYYAGLRPSEVIMLRPRTLHLPAEGWGRIDVREADISFDEPGPPKTGERSVPIPEILVTILRDWITTHELATDQLLFRTRTDRRPAASNWSRTWHRALRNIGHPALRVYDVRHTAATTWLAAGVPLGEVARRMGHSVETLVSIYVGALTGDEAVANERIERALAAALKPDLKVVS